MLPEPLILTYIMETLSIKQFSQTQGFVSINPTIRTNTNGYPFVTFINANNVAENIYFSKNAGKGVSNGEKITKDLLVTLQVAQTVNAAGEKRTKLISNSERIDLADLLG